MSEGMRKWNLLPNDTIFVIFQFLNTCDLFFVCQASKNWELSKLGRSDRMWKGKYESFVQVCNGLSELGKKIRKKHDKLDSFFEKYKIVHAEYNKRFGFKFANGIKCWVRMKSSHIISDFEIQSKILDRDIKAVFVGDGTVGKTSLLLRFDKGTFDNRYVPTIYDNKVKKCRLENINKTIGVNLWDTAGEEDYDTLRPLSYQETDVFIMVYDVACPTSLKNIKLQWYDEVTQYSENAALIIVAAKTDLRDDKEFIQQMEEYNKKIRTYRHFTESHLKRFIALKEGLGIAKDLQVECYLETSAKLAFNCTGDRFEGLQAAIFLAYVMKNYEGGKGNFGDTDGGNDRKKCYIM